MKFSEEDKKRIEAYYGKYLQRHGIYSSQALSWTSREAQQIRFRILAGIGSLEGKSILDAGCGLGDFYGFLKFNFANFDYLGIDLLPKMIKGARAKYPEAHFEIGDILEYRGRTFDYIISSGIFSFKIANHKTVYFEMLKKLFSFSRQGLAFNMLDRNGHLDDELYAAYDKEEIFSFCLTLTEKLRLIDDYSPQDFTFYLYH
jgi:trans-aconitate methyltransferase